MDYEKLTDDLIRKVVKKFGLSDTNQEFLDSIVTFDDFKEVSHQEFRKYLDNEELKF